MGESLNVAGGVRGELNLIVWGTGMACVCVVVSDTNTETDTKSQICADKLRLWGLGEPRCIVLWYGVMFVLY